MIRSLDIKTPTVYKEAKELSGGNQQKLVLARWILTEPKLMLLIEPTHGIDVKAKAEIYKILKNLAVKGMSVIICSTEYSELADICDRIIILRDGKVEKTLTGNEISELNIMQNL